MLGRIVAIALGDTSPGNTRKQQRSKEAEAAEQAAREAETSDNRVFRLNLNRAPDAAGKPLRFIAFGCQGSGNQNQAEVANLLNEICSDEENRPDFALILGDNVYDWGADAADDVNIRKCFDDIYLRPDLPNLANLPFFLLLGNHDENYQKKLKANLRREQGIERGMHEVAHSFMDDNRMDAETKKLLYSRTFFNLNEMPAWNMPRRYYSLIADDVQIFCMDSNTYIHDYLKFILHPETQHAENNQAAWLIAEAAKAREAGRKLILAQHHSLYTPGKRANQNDLDIYLSEREISQLKSELSIRVNETTSYNYALKECLRKQELEFDLVLAAHDHNLYYYNNKNKPDRHYGLCQLTAGGGGGKLQHRFRFNEQDQMGFFLSKTGAAVVSHIPGAEHFEFTIHTSDLQDRLEFNTDSHQALVYFDEENPETPQIQEFFAAVHKAIRKYLQYMSVNQSYAHGKDGIERAHKIWAYTNHPHPKSLREIIEDICRIARWENQVHTPDEYSLITILNRKLQHKFQKDIWELLETDSFSREQSPDSIELLPMRVNL